MSSQQTKYFMYVTLQDDDKISIFTADSASGKLSRQAEVGVIGGPAPLAIDPERKFLYVGRRANREISSFRIDPRSGVLLDLASDQPADTRQGQGAHCCPPE